VNPQKYYIRLHNYLIDAISYTDEILKFGLFVVLLGPFKVFQNLSLAQYVSPIRYAHIKNKIKASL